MSSTLWAGIRETTQYQSIPFTVQHKSATHPGGVIDLMRHYQGIDTRWTHQQDDNLVPFSFTAGLDYETMTEQRKGYENFVYQDGQYNLGTKGYLRRNERNLMWNVDPYLQTNWQLMRDLCLTAGVRYSSVWFDSNDNIINGCLQRRFVSLCRETGIFICPPDRNLKHLRLTNSRIVLTVQLV